MARAPKPSETSPVAPTVGQSRAELKQQTRQALLEAALTSMADKSFDSLSLREIAKAAGVVPTAFYRHFESTEELGLVLVDDAFRALRRMMRVAREAPLPHEELIRRSVETFAHYVKAHSAYFRFVVRERFGGSAVLRAAIRNEIRLFVSELAIDLARFSPLDQWKTPDLQMLAALLVTTMVGAVERLLDADARGEEALGEIVQLTEKHLQLVLAGAATFSA